MSHISFGDWKGKPSQQKDRKFGFAAKKEDCKMNVFVELGLNERAN